MLKTNFLYPRSNAFAIPSPNVTSGDNFFPSLTITRRSASKSKANPMEPLQLDIKSFKSSAVGSGPREHLSKFSLMIFT